MTTEQQQNVDDLLEEVTEGDGEPFVIIRHDQSVAVIMGIEYYEMLTGGIEE